MSNKEEGRCEMCNAVLEEDGYAPYCQSCNQRVCGNCSGYCDVCYLDMCNWCLNDANVCARCCRNAVTNNSKVSQDISKSGAQTGQSDQSTEIFVRKVYVESPYSGDIEANRDYAIRCMQDCLKRGEAPFLSHLLYTQVPQHGFVADDDQDHICVGREAAIQAAERWRRVADCTVVYTDRGSSRGMEAGIEDAKSIGQAVEYRSLKKSE